MNCNETSHLNPLRHDEGLGAGERSQLEAHLATCEVCGREADALASAMSALHSLAVPTLQTGEIDRVVEAAMPRTSSHWGGWWSHAAAVLVGVSLMAVGRGCQSDASSLVPGDAVELADARPVLEPAKEPQEVREVIVEVPVTEYVDRIVEVPVEVPVETVVEVPVEVLVEVRVEVPVEKVVERIVYRDRLVQPASTTAPTLSEPRTRVAEAAPGPATSVASKARQAPQRTHLEVRRVGGRVTLRTRGSLVEVVPVLIDTLESDDGAVVSAALDRLQSIHADLGLRAADLRPEAAPPTRRSGLRALLSSRGPAIRASELDDATLWRDWWTRQRAKDGSQRRTASI